MKKEEILKKYKTEKVDELAAHAEAKGAKIAYGVQAILTLFISVLCLVFWQPVALRAVFTVFWAQLASFGFGQYRVTKLKAYLVMFIAGTIASAAFFIGFLQLIQGD